MIAAAPSLDPVQRYEMLQAGLDLLDQGITVFDAELTLVAWNQTFLKLLDFPDHLAYVGAPFESFIRYNAERGEYGPGDKEIQIAQRIAAAREFAPDYFIIPGPGTTLGGAVAQSLILANWRGMASKVDFQRLQAESPLLVSMALPEQRALVA